MKAKSADKEKGNKKTESRPFDSQSHYPLMQDDKKKASGKKKDGK